MTSIKELCGRIKGVETLLKLKEVDKKISTYGPFSSSCIDGRLYPTYRLSGAVTGRLTSTGPNIHGVIRDLSFRGLFRPHGSGMKLIIGDYNQIELRVVAELSKDEEMLKAFRKGEDLHTLTASMMTGLGRGDITKEDRRLAKAVNFGILYGQGPQGLHNSALCNFNLNLKIEECQKALNKFFGTYSGISEWQKKCRHDAKACGYVKTALGRSRVFEGSVGGAGKRHTLIETESLNTAVQGSAADVTLMFLGVSMMKYITSKYKECNVNLVGCIHDEFIFECPVKIMHEVKADVEDAMIHAWMCIFPNASFNDIASVRIADSWANDE
eukprot:GHVO01018699.1.p1 GENE.GHVO01018699.1~~GHVO01018699.1.p1  ORF type:complete len:327 (+),score=60.56 GHVO01018699.1:382-1362(+)